MSNVYTGTGAPTSQNDNGTAEDKGSDHALVNQNISGAIFLVVMVRLRQAQHSTPSSHAFAFVRPSSSTITHTLRGSYLVSRFTSIHGSLKPLGRIWYGEIYSRERLVRGSPSPVHRRRRPPPAIQRH